MYRVKAYDTEGLESGYTTSAIRTVRYNVAPAINASSTSLGEKNAPFSFAYSVTDADGDTLTVTEKLDGKTTATRTGLASGTALTFEQASTADGFLRILNGSHTIKITANDGKESTSLNATFTKSVTSASVTLTTPLAVMVTLLWRSCRCPDPSRMMPRSRRKQPTTRWMILRSGRT